LKVLCSIKVDVARILGVLPSTRRKLVGQLAHFRRVWSADAELSAANRLAVVKLEWAHSRKHCWNSGRCSERESVAATPERTLKSLDDYDGLREEVVGELLVERRSKSEWRHCRCRTTNARFWVLIQNRLDTSTTCASR
jgi:hypothetical protein